MWAQTLPEHTNAETMKDRHMTPSLTLYKLDPDADLRGCELSYKVIENTDLRNADGLVLYRCMLIDSDVSPHCVQLDPVDYEYAQSISEDFINSRPEVTYSRPEQLESVYLFGIPLNEIYFKWSSAKDMTAVECSWIHDAPLEMKLTSCVFEDCELDFSRHPRYPNLSSYHPTFLSCIFSGGKFTWAQEEDASPIDKTRYVHFLLKKHCVFTDSEIEWGHTVIGIHEGAHFNRCRMTLEGSLLKLGEGVLDIIKCEVSGSFEMSRETHWGHLIVRTTSEAVEKACNAADIICEAFTPKGHVANTLITEKLDFSGVSLQNITFLNVEAAECDFSNVDFSGSVLLHSRLNPSLLTGAIFTNALIDPETLKSMGGVAPEGARILRPHADLSGLQLALDLFLKEYDLNHCKFNSVKSPEGIVFEDCNLRNASFEGLSAKRLYFRRCDIRGINFENVNAETLFFADCVYDNNTKVTETHIQDLAEWNKFQST